MDVCNLTLILIGTASINLNTCKSDNTCKGVDAGVLQNSTCFNSWQINLLMIFVF